MAVNARVELKFYGSHPTYDDFKRMHAAFKKQCKDNGIMKDYKEHEVYESKSRKKKRKKREAQLQRLKEKPKLLDNNMD